MSKHGKREKFTPRADPNSYYGRPILKPPAWDWRIPAYLFAGGLSAGSTLLSTGADLSGRPLLCRRGRIAALAGLGASTYFLVSDLGRPERFHHMLRVAKPTSPMSVGTWIIAGYSPGIGLAAVSELLPARWRSRLLGRVLCRLARPAALSSAALAPALASYTAVLLSQTSVPAWNSAHPYLPFVFTGSAAASSGGLGMLLAPVAEAGPARTFAATGAAAELLASRVMDSRLGLVGEAYEQGSAHRLRKASEYLTAAGLVGTLLGRHNRTAAAAAGLALMAGSVLQRFGVFAAGVASTRDPRFVVAPQRERLAARSGEDPQPSGSSSSSITASQATARE
ncbi:MAG TPA: NrfD/PsrC family molybdoenzyme membrane anchor subunit [Pseudonocardia sp.]|nr:NrfD/PsrC family molybdoenzyme membrane anchor subunit [Pseudonocardia sp.]